MDWLDGRFWMHDAYLLLLIERRAGTRERRVFASALSTPRLRLLQRRVPRKYNGIGLSRASADACDAKTLVSGVDGEPLVLCALTDAIAVGFPSEPALGPGPADCIVFLEPSCEDGDVPKTVQEGISTTLRGRPKHARARFIDRHVAHRLATLNARDRNGDCVAPGGIRCFRNLQFGPDVEDHLAQLESPGGTPDAREQAWRISTRRRKNGLIAGGDAATVEDAVR